MPVINIKNKSEDKIIFNNVYTEHYDPKLRESQITVNTMGDDSYKAYAKTKDYTIIAGGTRSHGVIVYDSNLTNIATITDSLYPSCTSSYAGIAGASLGTGSNQKAMFSGGSSGLSDHSDGSNQAAIFDNSLTKTVIYAFASDPNVKVAFMCSASVGDSAFFGGGNNVVNGGTNTQNGRYVFINNSGTHFGYNTSGLIVGYATAARISNSRAISIGGCNIMNTTISSYLSYAILINSSGSISYKDLITQAVIFAGKCEIDDETGALFAGGQTGSNTGSTNVYFFNTAGTYTACTSLSDVNAANSDRKGMLIGRNGMHIKSHDLDFMVFMLNGTYSIGLEYYYKGITKSSDIDTAITINYNNDNRKDGVGIGEYGVTSVIKKNNVSTASTVMERQPDYKLELSIPPFSKYKFDESAEQETTLISVDKIYESYNPISGYIKPNANASFSGNIN